jgi:dihydrofolate synthase/folylpolyglutamate synthase
MVTAMGFLLFREKQVDITVLEVGLGGRLDATNVVEPELCVITPVDFDHEKFLGRSLEAIASEKAGILKPAVPVVLARQRAEANAVIRGRAEELGCVVVDVPDVAAMADRRGSHIVLGELEFDCPLPGRHQIGNAITAALALQQLGIGNDAIARGIGETRWPGRLQRIRENPEIIVDGAHNPAGARALAAFVAEFYAEDKPVLIFGAMRDKAVEEMAGILFPHFHQVIVTAPHQPRALAPETLLELADHPCLRTAPDLRSAMEMAGETGRPTFVSGSLFLVGEASRSL